GVGAVLIGHSERRSIFGEGEEVLRRKLSAVLNAKLRVIYCVGETSEQRDAGQASAVVIQQLGVLRSFAGSDGQIDVAYEPVWAIGTGRTATGDQAGEMCRLVADELGALGFESVRVLYGGSVNP